MNSLIITDAQNLWWFESTRQSFDSSAGWVVFSSGFSWSRAAQWEGRGVSRRCSPGVSVDVSGVIPHSVCLTKPLGKSGGSAQVPCKACDRGRCTYPTYGQRRRSHYSARAVYICRMHVSYRVQHIRRESRRGGGDQRVNWLLSPWAEAIRVFQVSRLWSAPSPRRPLLDPQTRSSLF